MPQRRRSFDQGRSVERWLTQEAERLRNEAKTLPPGEQREQALRKASRFEQLAIADVQSHKLQ
jgi:hypothetical protein